MIRMLRLFALVTVLSLLTASAVAQVASAELHVTVKDAKGAVVRNATVTVENDITHTRRAQTENVEGEYSFRGLPPGHYVVTVQSEGFAKAIAKDVVLTVGQIAELPVALQLATVSQVVNVSSAADLVETQRTSAAMTIEQTRIDNLPINGRNYINFALTDSQFARDDAPSIGAAPTSGLNVGGQRARNNLVNVDGMNAVDNSTNGIRSTVSQDAVQEFQVLTNGYSAEYGQASGGVINIITKSGTNQFHGSVYGYLRNRYLQATNPFSNVYQPGYTRVQTGLTLGGPIKKDRTFYFFSFETTRRHETGFSSIGENNFGLTSSIDLAPYVSFMTGQPIPPGLLMTPVTPQQQAALAQIPFAYLASNPATRAQAASIAQYAILAGTGGSVALTGVNPVTALLGLGGGYFAPSVLGPGGAPQFDKLPASYVNLNSLRGNFPLFEGTSIYSLRIDHRINNDQQLSLRGSASPSTVNGIQVNAQGPQNYGQNAWSRTSDQTFRDMSISLQHTWTIGNNRVNEFRYQFSRRGLLYSYSREAPGGSSVAVNIPGYAFFGREPFSYVRRTEIRNQWTDNFTLTKGTHTIKFGADVNYLPLTADFTVNFGGIYNFGDIQLSPTLPSLSPIQAYGAGLPQNLIQGVGNPHDQFSNKTLGVFLQDSWRVNRRLTFNYGVRYDVEWTPTFKEPTALAQAAADALGITKGIPRDYNNIAPRIGLAWDPWGDGKSVVRASYGIFYDHPLLALAFDSAVADGSQAPQIVLFGGSPSGCNLNAANAFTGRLGCLPSSFNYLPNEQRFNPAPNAPSIWANQAFLNAGVPLPFLPFGFPTAKNFVYPYSNQVNLTFEHEFGKNTSLSLQYNFNGGRHLNRPINANAVRSDLLYNNWKTALAAGDVGAQSGPLFVGSVGAPCGIGPGGVPWVASAIMNFFRRSGVNPSYEAALNASPGGAQCWGLANQLAKLDGIGLGVTVPFSDMPANYSNGSSVYHGFTANLRKRFSEKYEGLVSYTWSHAIDDSTDLQSPLSPQNNYNPKAERSTSLFDQRHRLVISGVYESGKAFTGRRAMSKLFSDWTLAPIIEISSGRPFNIITGIDSNNDFGSTTDRPVEAKAGQTNSCGQTAVASPYSPTGYLIPGCFADGVFTGNLPRNAGIKPYTVFTDLRVSRRVHFGERYTFEGIMDVFNLMNKFNVADVNPLWNQAGTPTAAFDPRQFQLALRLTW